MRKGLISLFIPISVFAHPLLNLNSDERLVYDVLESSPYAEKTTTSIRPFSYRKAYFLTDKPSWVKEYMNALSRPDYFFKPINSITISTYYTSEKFFLLENREGTLLRKGINIYTTLDGYLSLGRRSVVYYSFRKRYNKERKDVKVHKLYWKLKLRKFSLEIGKDTVHFGPGENSVTLSSNAEPFPMLKIQTEESLNFLGKWDFIFVRGWLREKRQDRDNPNILALRAVWKPWDFVEIGGTRTSLYGGEGRPGYKLTEYPKLIIGSEENIPYSKYDTDGYGALDLSLYLPLNKLIEGVKTFKVYFQDSGTDIVAWWQKEDKKYEFPLGFYFAEKGTVAGFLLRTEKDIIRFEYTRTSKSHYTHHLYPIEGYTYKGLSLGHPYGKGVAECLFKHRRFLTDTFSVEYKLGYLKYPIFGTKTSVERYYISFEGEKRIRKIILSGFVRIDKTNNYDKDPSPVSFDIINEDKTFLSIGTSISWRF